MAVEAGHQFWGRESVAVIDFTCQDCIYETYSGNLGVAMTEHIRADGDQTHEHGRRIERTTTINSETRIAQIV